MMRIISGMFKGKKLKTLPGVNTRPTAERVKQSIFNILQFDIDDRDVLDIFAGTGQLSLEAISRGAKSAVLIESSKDASNIIKDNIKICNTNDKCRVINKDYKSSLNSLAGLKFSLIFLDPPYSKNMVSESLDMIYKNKLLSNNGIVVAEMDITDNHEEKIGDIVLYDIREYSRMKICFYKKDVTK